MKDYQKIINNITIVLVSPQIPENIGLCARVMKNTSFTNFSLVSPNLTPKSYEVAKRARDIISGAKIFPDLASSLKDTHFVVGMSRRARHGVEIYSFGSFLPSLVAQARKEKVSILFGREDVGLFQEEISFCNRVLCIAANPDFPSYNVAFSVGIVCYSILAYLLSLRNISARKLAKRKEVDMLLMFVKDTLPLIGMDSKKINTAMTSLRKVFLRANLSSNETELLKSIFVRLGQRVRK